LVVTPRERVVTHGPFVSKPLAPSPWSRVALLSLIWTLFVVLSHETPAFAFIADPGPTTQPGYSTDVYFHHEGPISSAPAPQLTSRDYRSLNLPYPLSESRIVVWVLAQQHLYFGAFVLGALWWVLLVEAASLGTRDAQRAQRYRAAGHEILRIVVLGITIAALLGALLVIALFGLYPGLTRYFAGVFRTTVLFAGVLFVTFGALPHCTTTPGPRPTRAEEPGTISASVCSSTSSEPGSCSWPLPGEHL